MSGQRVVGFFPLTLALSPLPRRSVSTLRTPRTLSALDSSLSVARYLPLPSLALSPFVPSPCAVG